MFNRLMAALLAISLAACSSIPRTLPPDSPPAGMAAPASAPQETGTEPLEREIRAGSADSDVRPDAHTGSVTAKVLVAVLLVGLVWAAVAALRQGVSRHIAQSCCR